jgi:hypothetical protein
MEHKLLPYIGAERSQAPLHELHIDDIQLGQIVVIATKNSLFILETDRRSDYGTLYGRLSRFSELPMTEESGKSYLADVIIQDEPCIIFSDTHFRNGESTYFHGIRYAGRTYEDIDCEVIHTAPIDGIWLYDSPE